MSSPKKNPDFSCGSYLQNSYPSPHRYPLGMGFGWVSHPTTSWSLASEWSARKLILRLCSRCLEKKRCVELTMIESKRSLRTNTSVECMYACMHVYVNVYVYVYVYVYVCMCGMCMCMCVCVYVCMCVCVYVCMCVCVYVCMCVCVYVYVCMYVCIYLSIYLCMYLCMCVCMYLCIYVRTGVTGRISPGEESFDSGFLHQLYSQSNFPTFLPRKAWVVWHLALFPTTFGTSSGQRSWFEGLGDWGEITTTPIG